jgi:ssDNA-binding Zn-finger/Zn-ribbon topoisomerase 1
MHDEINVCDENVCETLSVPSSTKEKGKRKRIDSESSKLWHCRLGHISRGRMERLVKESILPLLEFSDLDQCVDCIKGKYVKQSKKGAKRSTGVLEIIHGHLWSIPCDVCGRL